ncbi:putative RNA binding protein [Zostera marina]|uniref:Putative RNA binding protein n=1 Tax=Zostera marina TaxID=29655 RepID=A0A0K9Q045_ZOSMR|nr:putative RNA binding protein [Zostera marina]
MENYTFIAPHQQQTAGAFFAEHLPATSGPVTATLLVRHLPEAVPHDLLSRLFSYYGASSLRPCSDGRLRNCAFVDFKDEISASLAQSQLNRIRFHKKVLSVEKVRNAFSANLKQTSETRSSNESSSQTLPQSEFPSAGNSMKSNKPSSISISEPIAPRLGVDFPFPPHLEYAYPLPDGNILTNIVNALIAVPFFYTQVLHLMNKMNIPAPFRMALPTPPLPPPVPSSPQPPLPPFPEKPAVDVSSDESEMESSEDYVEPNQTRKRIKREVFIGPATDKCIAPKDVGLKHGTLMPKEAPIIKKKNSFQIKIASKSKLNEKKDGESTLIEEMENSEKPTELKPYATRQELENGKMLPEQILSLPMFKNYTAGNPATVLYIKNLAKDVIFEDFFYIFGSLFGSVEVVKSSLGVKLMQEGRMRGQAFVTFPSIDLAQQALKLVNGYVFKGKPMIIQFGRNPVTSNTK